MKNKCIIGIENEETWTERQDSYSLSQLKYKSCWGKITSLCLIWFNKNSSLRIVGTSTKYYCIMLE